MLEQILHYDTDLFLYLNGLGSEVWDKFWMFYTTKYNWIPLYAVLLYLMFKKKNTKMFILTLIVIALLITFTDSITNLFKHHLVKRLRPCYNVELEGLFRLVKSHCGGLHGYFSGHASNSMAVAVFVGLTLRAKYKYLIFILLFWASVMAYSRVYIGVHYPLDLISGMIFGAFAGYIFYKLDDYLQTRFRLQDAQLF
jgi:undecaprenyl-diphosphatase